MALLHSSAQVPKGCIVELRQVVFDLPSQIGMVKSDETGNKAGTGRLHAKNQQRHCGIPYYRPHLDLLAMYLSETACRRSTREHRLGRSLAGLYEDDIADEFVVWVSIESGRRMGDRAAAVCTVAAESLKAHGTCRGWSQCEKQGDVRGRS